MLASLPTTLASLALVSMGQIQARTVNTTFSLTAVQSPQHRG